MVFSVKKGDVVYASDGTLGFVAEVYRPEPTDDPDAGWAAVDVPDLNGRIYFTTADVTTRDETVPSVLLKLTYAEATDEAHRKQPRPIAEGKARAEPISPLDVGRPELPGDREDTSTLGSRTTEPARPPHPDAVRDWPSEDAPSP